MLNLQNTREADQAEHSALVAALKQHQTQLVVALVRGHLQNGQHVLQLWDSSITPG